MIEMTNSNNILDGCFLDIHTLQIQTLQYPNITSLLP